jgi:hypothetical protein
LVQHWRTARSIVLALLVITVVAAVGTYLTAPRRGGRLDPDSTSPDGAHALVALLREDGIEVITAETVADVERFARPNALVVAAETFNVVDDDLLQRLAAVPGDRLLVEPVTKSRAVLASEVRLRPVSTLGGEPGCDLPEAIRAGAVDFRASDTYEAAGAVNLQRCYDGALVRYQQDGRTITVVGGAGFMVNSGLLRQGNAALAMNLTGTRPRVIWYAPQHVEGGSKGSATVYDLLPNQVGWVVLQLCLVVMLVALWRGRRIGPLVAEDMPVVVRASETVEGRGRLYRARRARDRAASALRTAALQRLLPRLGLPTNAQPPLVVDAVSQRLGGSPEALWHILFGPPPDTDTDLVNLAHQLDYIERQVAQS